MFIRTARSGMTLIEFMVLLAMVAILALIAYPSFTSLVQRYRITGEAETLFSTLQYARSEAIKRNMTVYVTFTSGDDWCYGMNTGSACNCTLSGNCNLGVHAASSAQLITLSTAGLSSGSAIFEPTHGAVSASGSVTMTLYGQSSLITVSIARLGSLQMCSTGISGYTAC